MTQSTVYREKALLVGVLPPGEAPNHGEALEELEQLALTAGADVRGRVQQHRERPHPATYVGSGKVAEIGREADALGCNLVIFDNDLSPGQVRTLEKMLGRKVVDRAEVILDIFATHARTNEAKLQVELAQLEYALPRLRNLWKHFGQITGGIGSRGPGEQQIEVDRRLARRRITDLKREIARRATRKQREVAARAANFTVALVGYTNAGKSTLMNALTGAGVLVEDKLFSTLDTKTRAWTLPGRQKVLLSDTVGFIRKLPHDLVASFQATLEEVRWADLLLHVVDAGHPEAESQIASVRGVLEELGCARTPTIGVLNKADRVEDGLALRLLEKAFPEAVTCSARVGTGLDALAAAVERAIAGRFVEKTLAIPAGEGKVLADLARHGRILEQRYDDGVARIRAQVSIREAGKFKRYEVGRS